MTPRFSSLHRHFRRSNRGNSIVVVMVFLVALFAFAALSLDVGNVLREQRRVNVATDAAAIAGVAKLTGDTNNLASQKDAAITEAQAIAYTNGVTQTEIDNGARKGFPGAIQVGQWLGTNFVADAAPYNAIRVPARRDVQLFFGKVVGLSRMEPAVDSIAELGAISIPYGIPLWALNSIAIGSTLTLQPWPLQGVGGNWGPLDMCGTLAGAGDVESALSGSGCFSTPGDVVQTSTGFSGLDRGFNDIWNDPTRPNHIVVMPITSDYPDGNHNLVIQGYVVIQLLDNGSGGGANWRLNATVLGIGYAALRQYGLGPGRVLVE
jgi:Flp pilus assembly protein TadG